ncbi:MAG: hypothetical protein CL910_02935 [Deltaproteobacteria bacterium]|nr:hypothetical protein [Deltaproteobacteria bacterium]
MGAQEPFVSPGAAGRTPLRPDDGRLQRGRRSRARIREAARALFRERGFDATTLRAIAQRAGMGASSLYRHIRTKEELLVDELQELQEQAWHQFRRRRVSRGGPETASERLRRFLDAEHQLLARDPDLTTIALRATTHPEARVAGQVLALQDRTVGLLAEIMLQGRSRGELRRGVDVLAAARTIAHTTNGARIAWANGQLDGEACRRAIDTAVDVLFQGIGAPPG